MHFAAFTSNANQPRPALTWLSAQFCPADSAVRSVKTKTFCRPQQQKEKKMEEPNEEKFISMCMECEQTFYDEHIYKVHACYPIDSMVEPSLDYQMLPIKEEKIEEEEQIDFLCNEQINEEIDIKEEKMDAEDEPEADSSESELVIANVQSLQNVQQEFGNYFSNIIISIQGMIKQEIIFIL